MINVNQPKITEEINQLHKVKRFSQKVAIRIIRSLDSTSRKTNTSDTSEREAANVFRKMIKLPHSELLISPLLNKHYVKNDDSNILIIMDQSELTVINHVFGYNIHLSPKTYKVLYDAFVREVEIRRNEMEESFRTNVKHSLKTLITKIDEQI
jgi:Holliday junction resolvasome RuvABC DNA-binding subunit